MERIAGISQRTCISSHFFFNNHILTKINLWLQLFNKTSGWDPSSKIYYLSHSFRSWWCSNSTGQLFILISKLMCTFHHPLTYFSFCSHFSGLCYFLILYSAKICVHILMCFLSIFILTFLQVSFLNYFPISTLLVISLYCFAWLACISLPSILCVFPSNISKVHSWHLFIL